MVRLMLRNYTRVAFIDTGVYEHRALPSLRAPNAERFGLRFEEIEGSPIARREAPLRPVGRGVRRRGARRDDRRTSSSLRPQRRRRGCRARPWLSRIALSKSTSSRPAGASTSPPARRSARRRAARRRSGSRPICGGDGTCGRCRVVVMDRHRCPRRSPPTAVPLAQTEIAAGQRLACRVARRRSPSRSTSPRRRSSPDQRLQVDGPAAHRRRRGSRARRTRSSRPPPSLDVRAPTSTGSAAPSTSAHGLRRARRPGPRWSAS